VDKSGAIEANELRDLYRQARGEILKPQELSDAMKSMDIDGGGTVEFDEFAVWWCVALAPVPDAAPSLCLRVWLRAQEGQRRRPGEVQPPGLDDLGDRFTRRC
jgi:hypothetical protein